MGGMAGRNGATQGRCRFRKTGGQGSKAVYQGAADAEATTPAVCFFFQGFMFFGSWAGGTTERGRRLDYFGDRRVFSQGRGEGGFV